jgi:L-2-hydroxyglutarate oxidase LhgO
MPSRQWRPPGRLEAAILYDLVIIGGGIIGLSAAMEALRRFPDLRLLVVEKESRVGLHQSGRNSGVIHTGLYYRPASLKATLCVEGAAAMLSFCREHGIPHEICGKVVVATRERELPALQELHRRGTANGVRGLALVGPERLAEIEPNCKGLRGLHVPGAAIADFGVVTGKYAENVTAAGGTIRTGARVTGLARRGGEVIVESTAGSFATRRLINCAGLHSDRVARMAGETIDTIIVPFRGEYHEIAPGRRHLVRGLIYPVPDPGLPFLDVHLTRTVRGTVEAGPNAVLAWKREGYRRTDFSLGDTARTLAHAGFWRMASRHWRRGLVEVHRSLSRGAFLRAVRRFLPELCASDLLPGGAGVRAQAVDGAGNLLDDFRIVRTDRMIHVLNVPSPAATASIPIGRWIAGMLAEMPSPARPRA